jgi:hypothetical protein
MRYLVAALALLPLLMTEQAVAKPHGCPPGLAKKSPACVPPGHAGKGIRSIREGDYLYDYSYHQIRYPDRYGLLPPRRGEEYYIVDGRIFSVDQSTYEILDLIGAVAAILD